MAMLKLIRSEATPPPGDAGTWGELVAWFSELVIRLDRGDLAGAAEAQAAMARHGFRVTFRRSALAGKGGAR